MFGTKQQSKSHKGKYRIFTVLIARQGTDLEEYKEKLSHWLSILASCKSCFEIELMEDGDFKGCYAYTEIWENQSKWQQELKEKSQDKEFQDLIHYIFTKAGRDISFIFRGFYILEELKKDM